MLHSLLASLHAARSRAIHRYVCFSGWCPSWAPMSIERPGSGLCSEARASGGHLSYRVSYARRISGEAVDGSTARGTRYPANGIGIYSRDRFDKSEGDMC